MVMNGFEAYRQHVNPPLAQTESSAGLARRFVRAQGCRLWDDREAEHLDFSSARGALNLGHNHPVIVKSLTNAILKQTPQVYGAGGSPAMGKLAAQLVRLAGPPFRIASFSNSGTEAMESALKIARAATRRSKIIYCDGAYHGVSLGCLSMIAQGPWREPFEPLLPEFIDIPFDDLEALETVLKAHACAAFVVEPIQAEGGVGVPKREYLALARELCRQYGALLILDEVQTGMGRTGPLFAFQESGSPPDVCVAANAMGGGVMPIGACLTRRKIFDLAYGSYEMHVGCCSTFGGNTFSCAVALKALELLASDTLQTKVRANGAYLLKSLRQKFENNLLIRDIRGRGLLIGVEFAPSAHPWLYLEHLGIPEFAQQNAVPALIAKRLLKHRIVTHVCGNNWNVLKIEPPLIVEREDIDRLIEALDEALQWVGSISESS